MGRSVGANQLITKFMGFPWTMNGGEQGYYRNAGRLQNSDTTIENLATYRLPVRANVPDQNLIISARQIRNSEPIYTGQGWINHQWREVSYWYDSAGYLVEVLGAAACFISASGSRLQNIPAQALEVE